MLHSLRAESLGIAPRVTVRSAIMAFWCYGSAEIVGQSGDCHPAIFPGSGCHLRWYHRRGQGQSCWVFVYADEERGVRLLLGMACLWPSAAWMTCLSIGIGLQLHHRDAVDW